MTEQQRHALDDELADGGRSRRITIARRMGGDLQRSRHRGP